MTPLKVKVVLTIIVLRVTYSYCNSIINYQLRIGLLLPFDDPYLKPYMGYETSASAVTIALDKIYEEQLLPGANIRYDRLNLCYRL